MLRFYLNSFIYVCFIQFHWVSSEMRKGVQKIYAEVAPTYELVNHILTFGLDILWRRSAARRSEAHGGQLILDVCCGTGEMAQILSKKLAGKSKIVLADFSLPMIDIARKRKGLSGVHFHLAEADRLPYKNNSFDQVLISFATRNLNTRKDILVAHLKEFHRILKPGGILINLETSQPSTSVLKKLFHLYIKMVVHPVGSLISGSSPGYRYLAFTIPRFYPADEFSSLLQTAGFSRVDLKSLLGGIAALHEATK